MGKILTIRLVAETYREDEVFSAWPRLCALAWPGQGELRGREWILTGIPARLASAVEGERQRHGVRELAAALLEESRFGDWNADTKAGLTDLLQDLEKNVASLEEALGDWQPQAANTASSAIEDTLDAMERRAEQA